MKSQKIKLKFKRPVSPLLNVHKIIFKSKLMKLSLKVFLKMVMEITSFRSTLMMVMWLISMVH